MTLLTVPRGFFMLILLPFIMGAIVWDCVPYDGSADVCNITVGTPVLAWNTNPHAQFVSVLRGRQFLAFTKVPEPCYTYAMIMICATHMRPCYTVGNETLMYPQNPCYHSCKDFVDACQEPFEKAGIPLWAFGYFPAAPYGLPEWTNASDCSMPDGLYKNEEYFPKEFTNYTSINTTGTQINQSYIIQPCFAPEVTLYEAPCTEPLVHDGDLYCSFVCPLPSLSDDEYYSAKVMQGVVSWFSWALSAALIISYLVTPALRKFPKVLLMATAFGANILAGGMVLPTFAGYDNIWCGGSETYIAPDTYFYLTGLSGYIGVVDSIDALRVKSSACSFQGAILLFGFLSCTFWWAIIAFNMCLEIYFGNFLTGPKWKWIRIVAYNVVGWGIPFVFMVIPTSAEKMTFEPAGTFCFITSEDDYAWILVFFFIPVGICLLLGSVLFILSLIKLTVVAFRVRKYKEVLVPYVRLLLFIFVFFLVLTLFSAYTINNSANESTISSGYANYYQCLTGSTFTATEDCELDSDVSNYPLVMLKGFAISILGTLLFFIFFCSTVIIKQWYKIILGIGRMIWSRDKVAAQKFIGLVGWATSSRMTSLSASNTMAMSAVGDIKDEDDEDDEGETENRKKGDHTTDLEDEEDEEGSSSSTADGKEESD